MLLETGCASIHHQSHFTPNYFKCVTFERNYDGDTAIFTIRGVHPFFGKDISVRFKHIDTPEIKGSGTCEKRAAIEARNLVHNILSEARCIDLTNAEKDKYFRILADVKADGVLISSILVKRGLAVNYDGRTKQKVDWCEGKS